MSALCDVCQKRPGTHTVMSAGTETWACDVCGIHCDCGKPKSFDAVACDRCLGKERIGEFHTCPSCNRDCYCDGGDTLNCEHECPEDFDDSDAEE